jgi:hypothetical protein
MVVVEEPKREQVILGMSDSYSPTRLLRIVHHPRIRPILRSHETNLVGDNTQQFNNTLVLSREECFNDLLDAKSRYEMMPTPSDTLPHAFASGGLGSSYL